MGTRFPLRMFALTSFAAVTFLAFGAEPERDPVAAIQRSPDYLEQRVRGVGLGAWGGPIRVDLELEQSTHRPVRSIWIDRPAFSLGEDPLAGKVQIALTGQIYGARDEARAAIAGSALSSPSTTVYAYYRGEDGIVFPTIISQATAPRVIQAIDRVLQQEQANAKAASAVLLESSLLLAGVRYPFVARPPSTTGRLIIEAGRRLSADELSIAGKLVSEGRVVRVVAESTKRTADFLVDGVATELKTVSRITSDDLSGALARRILEGAGQGEHIIVDARRQAGLTHELAVRAIRRAYGFDKHAQRIKLIRIIAQSFDLTLPPG